MTDAAERRIAEIVGAVARQALADRGRSWIALLDDGGPEPELAARLLESSLGGGIVLRVGTDGAGVEPFLPGINAVPGWRAMEEVRRLRARLLDAGLAAHPGNGLLRLGGALTAHPANKTALLLGGELPPEPLLPLGDLWATDVLALAGGWSAPPEIAALAEAAGGIETLDAALRRRIDGRDRGGLDTLPSEVAAEVRDRLAAGSAARRNPRIVPKLGGRTLCIDLME
jgi:hypothetical protein